MIVGPPHGRPAPLPSCLWVRTARARRGSPTAAPREKSATSCSSLPASILEKSSRSFMRPSGLSAADLAVLRHCRWSPSSFRVSMPPKSSTRRSIPLRFLLLRNDVRRCHRPPPPSVILHGVAVIGGHTPLDVRELLYLLPLPGQARLKGRFDAAGPAFLARVGNRSQLGLCPGPTSTPYPWPGLTSVPLVYSRRTSSFLQRPSMTMPDQESETGRPEGMPLSCRPSSGDERTFGVSGGT